MKTCSASFLIHRRAFSLMEVLLAVFILGIGLIMVATIFPVGADWTRQTTEDSIAQTIAKNAVTTVQNYYGQSGPNAGVLSTLPPLNPTALTPIDLRVLPNFTTIPVSERCYQFGNPNPFPAPSPQSCLYWWTALVRVQPGQTASPARRYDLYILVFRKGDASQIFTPQLPFPAGSGSNELTGVRDYPMDPTSPVMSRLLEPTLLYAPYSQSISKTFNTNLTPPVNDCVPPVGYIGIGQTSGTVFRQTVDIANSTANPRPFLKGQTSATTPPNENVIYAAPADGTTASPLIYVYQTTISL
jgi:prepilin-type N-terminal cleavage/methylation domain-containing protein